MTQLSLTQFAFLGFITLFILLLLNILTLRTILTLSKVIEINAFSPLGDDYSPYYKRLTRAHANLYENTPIWLGLLGFAILTGKESICDSLAICFFIARLVQVIVHLLSTAPWAIYLRFTCFNIQIGIGLYWLYCFWRI